MRTFLRMILKPLSFLPALFMMYMIFSFSAQDGVTSAQLSYKVSYKIVETGAQLLGADFEPWEIEKIASRFHGSVRKLAHMTEYFALAVSVAFPLYVYGLRGFPLLLVAGMFCVAFACGDEYHQSLVSGRSPSKKDVAIDSIGVFFGVIVVRIVGWTGRKTIFRPLSKKSSKKKSGHHIQPDYQAQPMYPVQADYPMQPGYPAQSRYPTQPVYPAQPGYHVQPNYQAQVGRHAQPNYPVQPGYHAQPNCHTQQGRPVQYGYPSQAGASAPRPDSDILSEDMSLRKLMSDLKEQKKSGHSDKKTARKPPLQDNEIPVNEINLND